MAAVRPNVHEIRIIKLYASIPRPTGAERLIEPFSPSSPQGDLKECVMPENWYRLPWKRL